MRACVHACACVFKSPCPQDSRTLPAAYSTFVLISSDQVLPSAFKPANQPM